MRGRSTIFVDAEGVSSAGIGQRMVTNTTFLLIPPAVRAVSGIATVALVSRYLGLPRFGEYALALSFVGAFLGILADWGLATICLREMPQDWARAPTLLRNAAALQLVISGLSYAALIAGALLVPYPIEVKVAIAVYGTVLLFLPLDILVLPYQSALQVRRLVLPSVTGSVLMIPLFGCVFLFRGGVVAMVAVPLLALTVQYVWIGILGLPLVAGASGSVTAGWKRLLVQAWPLSGITVIGALYLQLPSLGLSAVGLTAVAIFSAAARIPQQLVAFVPLAIRAATFPQLSRLWVSDKPGFARMLDVVVHGSLLTGIPLFFSFSAASHLIIDAIYGQRFHAAGDPLAILFGMFAMATPAILVGEALVISGHQRTNLLIQLVSAVVLVAGLRTLIPPFGASGAAWALDASFAVIVSMTVAAAQYHLGSLAPGRAFLPGILAVAAGYGAVQVTSGLPLALRVVLPGVASFTLIAAMRRRETGLIGLAIARTVRPYLRARS